MPTGRAKGLQLIAVNVDDSSETKRDSRRFGASEFSFPILRGSDDVAAIYNILYRQLFDRHRDLSLPTSFLIDSDGDIVKVYQGPIVTEHVERDFQRIPRHRRGTTGEGTAFPERRVHRWSSAATIFPTALCFFSVDIWIRLKSRFQQALRDDPSSAEALYGIGSVYLNQNKNAAARETFERAVKLPANYPDTLPDAWNNLGVIATREGRVDDSVRCFQDALRAESASSAVARQSGQCLSSAKALGRCA